MTRSNSARASKKFWVRIPTRKKEERRTVVIVDANEETKIPQPKLDFVPEQFKVLDPARNVFSRPNSGISRVLTGRKKKREKKESMLHIRLDTDQKRHRADPPPPSSSQSAYTRHTPTRTGPCLPLCSEDEDMLKDVLVDGVPAVVPLLLPVPCPKGSVKPFMRRKLFAAEGGE